MFYNSKDMWKLELLDNFQKNALPKIKKIQKQRSILNFLEITKSSTDEVTHSNILAWLFNPQETHKLGNAFLKVFLERLNINLPTKISSNFRVDREFFFGWKINRSFNYR